MRFYYFSLFSWMAYVVVVSVGIVLLWLLWTKLLKLKTRNPVYWVLAAAILVAPWAEELWIAYNFDRLCRKDAGVFVNKTVEVDGYYDDSGIGRTRIVGGPSYKFVEGPAADGKYRRIEHATAEERERAIALYVEKNSGRKPGEKEWFTQSLNDNVQITVEMDTGHAWLATKLDKPHARYHYKKVDSHMPVSHRIKRFENVVLDTQSGEVLGRYTDYSRGAYWFFISLGAPSIECNETKGKDPLVYRAVLSPPKSK